MACSRLLRFLSIVLIGGLLMVLGCAKGADREADLEPGAPLYLPAETNPSDPEATGVAATEQDPASTDEAKASGAGEGSWVNALGLQDETQRDAATASPSQPASDPGGGRRAPSATGRQDRPRSAEFISRYDADGDGKLTSEELPAGGERLMEADVDGNGAITREELNEARSTITTRRGQRPTEATPPGVGAGPRGFERFDGNGDGFLTEDEVRGRFWERIIEADTNGDNRISQQEYEKFRQENPWQGQGENRRGPGAGE